jgi:hypothetical protein
VLKLRHEKCESTEYSALVLTPSGILGQARATKGSARKIESGGEDAIFHLFFFWFSQLM